MHPTKPLPNPFVALFLWVNSWLYHIYCVILLNDIDDYDDNDDFQDDDDDDDDGNKNESAYF